MRVIPARGVCSFVKRGNDQVRRIRTILFSVKLRVLNPNLFLKPPHKKQKKRDKKRRHIHITDAHTSSRMFASSCAQVVVSPPKKVRAFVVVSVLVVASLWVSGG